MSSKNIGFSEIGGYFIGQNIIADYHQDHGISIIISLDCSFEITQKGSEPQKFMGVIIQKDVNYSFNSLSRDPILFIHLDPFSKPGLNLSHQNPPISELNISPLKDSIKELLYPTKKSVSEKRDSTLIFEKVVYQIAQDYPTPALMDERIVEVIRIIRNSEATNFTMEQAAKMIHLSPSRFAHLFKQETGMTFRKFIRHNKLIKSLYAMYKNHNLTEASFFGGFADQPHFTRTFKNAFGIRPSESNK